MKTNNLIFLILSFLPVILNGQQISTEKKTIEYTNGLELFSICKINPEVTITDGQDYYWYNSFSGIKKTKGGIGGQLLHGKYQFFDTNGNLTIEANYFLGLKHGIIRTWDDDGKIKETTKHDKGNCIYLKFTNDDGYQIEWIGEMFSVGCIKNVYSSYGKLLSEEKCFEPFKFHVKRYFEDGGEGIQESEYTTSFGDYFYGEYKVFYKNGNLRVHGEYIENKKTGDWNYYNVNGSITNVEKFRIYTENYPNGKLKIEGSQFYVENENKWIRDGRWLFYEDNGEDLEKIVEYNYGEIID